jgi:hypothetical protein
MLKRLAIFGAAALIVAVVLVARYDAGGKSYDVQCKQSGQPASALGTFACTIEPHQNAEQREYNPLWWHEFFAWPEGITASLVMFTLIAITWQAWETRKAAEAASMQASHLAASERAWIIVDPGNISDDFEPDPSTLQMMEIRPLVRNCGKTMARIIRGSIRAHAIASKSNLPPNPDYKRRIDFNIQVPSGPVVQPLLARISLSDFIEYREGKSVLYIYGFLDYLDFAKQERQSRFCLEYVVPSGFDGTKRGFYNSVSAPKSYTECT